MRRAFSARWRWGNFARRTGFDGSRAYWESRYAQGGTSGSGSVGRLAVFKADYINEFIRRHNVDDVIELGCGDGRQLSLMRYRDYLGLNVSPTAIEICRTRFADDASKQFRLLGNHDAKYRELALSLDVAYHLIEDDIFEEHLNLLFGWASRFVILYTTNVDLAWEGHVRHRRVLPYIQRWFPDWTLIEQVSPRFPSAYRPDAQDSSMCEFFAFKRQNRG